MDLILATDTGVEEMVLTEDCDFEIGGSNDFELKVPLSRWTGDIDYDKRIYIPNTEFGGIVGEIESDTGDGIVYVRGYTWRGMLANKIIEPFAGSDYRIVSGDIAGWVSMIRDEFPGLFINVAELTGKTVDKYKFARYCTLLDGMTDLLASKGYKLKLYYQHGYVWVDVVPIVDYADEIEISQDSRLRFKVQDNRRGVNHLICLGKGELREREVVHLYAHPDGTINQTQDKAYTGIHEITDIYDYSSAEGDDLVDGGIERLKKLMNSQQFTADLNDITDMEIDIGDIISGRDYVTGLWASQPITKKIFKITGGRVTVKYEID